MCMANVQSTVVLVKPDALQRGLVGEIISRFEKKGLKLLALKLTSFDEDVSEVWYAHHKGKPFFSNLKKYMASTPVVAMLWEGLDAIGTVRRMVGITKGREAEMGSIRGDFAMSGSQNLIHASDNEDSSEKERGIIFANSEIFDYESLLDTLIYSEDDLK